MPLEVWLTLAAMFVGGLVARSNNPALFPDVVVAILIMGAIASLGELLLMRKLWKFLYLYRTSGGEPTNFEWTNAAAERMDNLVAYVPWGFALGVGGGLGTLSTDNPLVNLATVVAGAVVATAIYVGAFWTVSKLTDPVSPKGSARMRLEPRG